jgi:hypothetical protein
MQGPIYELARRGRKSEAAAGSEGETVAEEKANEEATGEHAHEHTHEAGTFGAVPCAYCQRRNPDSNNNLATQAADMLYRYDTTRNSAYIHTYARTFKLPQ